jgi:AMIN domain
MHHPDRRTPTPEQLSHSPKARTTVVRLQAVCLALLLLWPITASAAPPTLLPSVEFNDAPGSLTLVLSLSHKPENLRTFTLKAPDRLVLDISPARVATPLLQQSSESTLIHRVRGAQFNSQTVRLVLDLRQFVRHEVISQPDSDSASPYRIAVRLQSLDSGQPLEPGSLALALPEVPAARSEGHAPPLPQSTAGESVSTLDKTANAEEATPQPSSWGTMDLSALLRGKAAQQFQQTSDPDQTLRNTIRVEGKWTPASTTNTYVLGSLQSDSLWFGPEPSSSEFDLSMHEAYLFHTSENLELRLGRQIVRWGKTDQISPVDNLNPQDMREFFIPDLEDRKIPNWMVRARAFPGTTGLFDAVSFEAVYVPFFESDDFDWTGTTWALLGVEETAWRIEEEYPTKNLGNSDYGLRTTASAGGWDLAVSWLQATEKTPRFQQEPFNPKGPTLHASYGRQNIYGFEFETTLNTFGFRGEVAYMDRQSWNTDTFDPVSSPLLKWVLGLDYAGEADWYANVQLSHQHIFQYEDDILYLRQDNFYLNGEINREFLRGDVILKVAYAVDLQGGGAFITPEAIWRAIENLELSLGANCFFGPEDSYFGRYRDNNQGFLKGTYRF